MKSDLGQLRLLCCWLIGLLVSGALLAKYSATPGLRDQTRATIPNTDVFSSFKSAGTLFIGLHPQCSCSVASLRQFRRVLASAEVTPRVVILLFQKKETKSELATSRISAEWKDIPGLTLQPDKGGAMSREFGILTSGDIAFYGPDGRLAFQGGITPSRGHEGEGEGSRKLREALRSPGTLLEPTAVFGCPIQARS